MDGWVSTSLHSNTAKQITLRHRPSVQHGTHCLRFHRRQPSNLLHTHDTRSGSSDAFPSLVCIVHTTIHRARLVNVILCACSPAAAGSRKRNRTHVLGTEYTINIVTSRNKTIIISMARFVHGRCHESDAPSTSRNVHNTRRSILQNLLRIPTHQGPFQHANNTSEKVARAREKKKQTRPPLLVHGQLTSQEGRHPLGKGGLCRRRDRAGSQIKVKDSLGKGGVHHGAHQLVSNQEDHLILSFPP